MRVGGRASALAVLVVAIGGGLTARPDPGLRAQQEEDASPAIGLQADTTGSAEAERLARYRSAAEASEQPIDFYNYGTALLGAERWTEARQNLRRALSADNETVATFARYNGALASAQSARHERGQAEERRERLVEARDAFRSVLRRAPADEDARWNLELVERWLRELQGGGGDGAGPSRAPSSGAGSALPQGGDQSGSPVELGPEEAAALLEAAGEAENSVRERLLGRARLRDPVVERNW